MAIARAMTRSSAEPAGRSRLFPAVLEHGLSGARFAFDFADPPDDTHEPMQGRHRIHGRPPRRVALPAASIRPGTPPVKPAVNLDHPTPRGAAARTGGGEH